MISLNKTTPINNLVQSITQIYVNEFKKPNYSILFCSFGIFFVLITGKMPDTRISNDGNNVYNIEYLLVIHYFFQM